MLPTRNDLCRWLMRVSLLNTGNQCYYNAALVAWLWAHLCRKDWQPSCLGDTWRTLLRGLSDLPLTYDWATSAWLQPLLRRWGMTGQQADAAEFVQYLLSFTQAQRLTWQWEKRQEEDDIITTMSSEHVDLIQLQFLIQHVDSPHDLTVNDLFDHWSQEEGPRQALSPCASPQLVAVHLERGVQDSENHIIKCTKIAQFEAGIDVPFYQDNSGLGVDWVTMRVIAAVCHLGTSQHNGHYRAAVRYESGSNQNAWLLTEDNSPPERVARLPRWFMENVTILWLTHEVDVVLPKDCQAEVNYRWRDDQGVPPFPVIPQRWRIG